ncbi:MAG TPA: DUF4394 domain-containing protein [Polyangiaceae bacterium]|nr:DUF4394 domain-containing protein [Polyangiaceae bacterium]
MKRYLTCLMPFVALAALAMTPACGDDDDDDNPSTQGSGGRAGAGGSGTGGSGTGGSGTGGSAGTGGAGGTGGAPATPPPTPAAYDIVVVNGNGDLLAFKSDTPGTSTKLEVTGLDGTLDGIDVRSSDGLLYGLTDTGNLYKLDVDLAAGKATATGGTAVANFAAGEGGYGFDFNPKSAIATEKGGDGGNALRVITDTANYRLNPFANSVAGTDTPLVYKAQDPGEGKAIQIVAAAYLNAYKGTASTVLYDINAATDTLVQQGDPDPNLGVLITIGALGNVDVGDAAGFDIVTTSSGGAVVNVAYLAADTTLYTVDLSTGAATSVGEIGEANDVKGLAVLPPSP